ncbi:UNVERIFIED_ORG: hypothetical protein GGD51_006312 [Rhizobium esperanzae]|uniref:hypothetical protein n=1 Tax=Rhizobium phaseoli TaxID=396 RepID=UPI0011AE2E51|nr:hypothetical protein [Rhizobium phaseoli]
MKYALAAGKQKGCSPPEMRRKGADDCLTKGKPFLQLLAQAEVKKCCLRDSGTCSAEGDPSEGFAQMTDFIWNSSIFCAERGAPVGKGAVNGNLKNLPDSIPGSLIQRKSGDGSRKSFA